MASLENCSLFWLQKVKYVKVKKLFNRFKRSEGRLFVAKMSWMTKRVS